MPTIHHTLLNTATMGKSLTVIIDNKPRTIRDSHINFQEIVHALEADEQDAQLIIDLIEERPRQSLINKVRKLTGLLDYDGEDITFNGKTLGGPVVEHIHALLQQEDETSASTADQWKPLALFLERLQKNPSFNSRNQLYTWLDKYGLTITNDGRFIAYKGLRTDDHSQFSGGAYVDGVWVDGHVPNKVGTTISLDRHDIDDNPANYCSYGLHAGNWEYASTYARGRLAVVLIDPADVVSVPTDCAGQKIRTCSYDVLEIKDIADLDYLGKYGVIGTDEDEDESEWDENEYEENYEDEDEEDESDSDQTNFDPTYYGPNNLDEIL